MAKPHPKFSELPLNPDDPPYSAWGLYGDGDERGTLNLLTAERTLEAAKEIKTGVSVGLNWPVHMMDYAGDFREPTKHEIFEIGKNMNDDKLTLNTQIGSQWDGLRHQGFDDGRFYNGLTQADIYSKTTTRLGIHAWTAHGIVGRGVLINYASYATRNNIRYDPLGHHAIPLATLHAIAAESRGIVFRPGDILLLRTGFTRAYEAADLARKHDLMAKSPFEYPGLESTVAVLRFLWDAGIAAVAGDCPGFEAWPPGAAEGGEGLEGAGMHPTLLAGFGMPIGEMFDLEALAAQCERLGRWSFFFTSMPLNVSGGVASPPNAMAIF